MMAILRVNHSVQTKVKLSNTLRNWLPILHSSLSDLNEVLEPFIQDNPVIEVSSGFEENFEKIIPKKNTLSAISNSRTKQIEALTIQKQSLYDILDKQLQAPLFPTPISQQIASFIIQNLDENGYYEGDSDIFCLNNSISLDIFESVRKRFMYIEPVGIGAKDLLESFLFQLGDSNISDEAYSLAKKMIDDLKNIHIYSKELFFNEAIHVIKSFKNPPAIEFLEDSTQIVPDLMIFVDESNNIEVKLNDSYYPTINIDYTYKIQHEFISQKIKEAKSLVDALEMRKATLYKIGLMIIEYQYDFFTGGDIMPLTLKVLADELGHNPSTISRAIANKYIACNRGIYAMKDFFTTAISGNLSNSTIKDYLLFLIKQESQNKPLSDNKLLNLIQEKFKIKMVRRTIAKYRNQLNIAGSNERKKLYQLNV